MFWEIAWGSTESLEIISTEVVVEQKFPSVTVVDSAGTQVIGDVYHTDIDNLTITFINQFSGKAFLN